MRHVLGQDPWDKEVEIADAIMRHRRVAVRGCVGSGKTHAAAMSILAWLLSRHPARAFTIAPSYRQVDNNLWGELRRMHAVAAVPLGGHMYETTEWRLAADWYALGFSTKDPNMVHGIHGENDLLVIDDAHGVSRGLEDEVENMMAGGQTHVLSLFNPVALAGATYNCTHSMAHLYHNIKIAYSDTPNGLADAIVIPGMLQPQTVTEWRRIYGPESNFCRVKIDAEYPRQEPDTLIPLDWVESAFDREVADPHHVTLGVDVARFGDDRTVIYPISGRKVYDPTVIRKMDLMDVAGAVAACAARHHAQGILIDEVGLGAGVLDRLREQGYRVSGAMAGAKARDEARFVDLRSELWWELRDALNPDNPAAISLPRDPELQAEITSVKYRIASDRRIRVEPKDDMKGRLGISPDKADALCLALRAAMPSMRPVAALGNRFTAQQQQRRADWMD